jgi:MGT family glycosyltransferase
VPYRILVVNVASHGHLYPTLPVVAELIRRGHAVSYLTSPGFAAVVAATGARVLPYESVIAHLDPAEVFGEDEVGARPHMLYLRENEAILHAALAGYGLQAPDVVLYGDFPMVAGQLLAAAYRRPAVRLSAAFASNEHYSFSGAMIEASGFVDPLHLPSFRKQLEALLAEHGVDRRPEEFWHAVEARNLVFIPKAFQFAGDTFDERFAFVGPCFGPRALGQWAPPAGAGEGRPIVLISLGTTFNDQPRFFRDTVAAFAATAWHVVLTLGGRVAPEELGPLPGNVEAHAWVPHLDVLAHATVCVTHGGMGTLMEALHWGRPLVVVPHSPDVAPMAARVAQLGLGAVLDPAATDGAGLLEAVGRVAADAAVLARVRQLQRHIRAAGGAPRAADALEVHLARIGV